MLQGTTLLPQCLVGLITGVQSPHEDPPQAAAWLSQQHIFTPHKHSSVVDGAGTEGATVHRAQPLSPPPVPYVPSAALPWGLSAPWGAVSPSNNPIALWMCHPGSASPLLPWGTGAALLASAPINSGSVLVFQFFPVCLRFMLSQRSAWCTQGLAPSFVRWRGQIKGSGFTPNLVLLPVAFVLRQGREERGVSAAGPLPRWCWGCGPLPAPGSSWEQRSQFSRGQVLVLLENKLGAGSLPPWENQRPFPERLAGAAQRALLSSRRHKGKSRASKQYLCCAAQGPFVSVHPAGSVLAGCHLGTALFREPAAFPSSTTLRRLQGLVLLDPRCCWIRSPSLLPFLTSWLLAPSDAGPSSSLPCSDDAICLPQPAGRVCWHGTSRRLRWLF